jgi:hypothetical protein
MSSAGYRFVHCLPTPIAATMVSQFYPRKEDDDTDKSEKTVKRKKSFENHVYLVVTWGASVAEVSLVKSEGKHFGSKLQMLGFGYPLSSTFYNLLNE